MPPIGRLFFVSDRNHYFNIHYSREPRRASRVRGFWFIWALRPRLWRVSFCTANPKERRLKPSLFFQLGGFLTAGLQFFWNSEIAKRLPHNWGMERKIRSLPSICRCGTAAFPTPSPGIPSAEVPACSVRRGILVARAGFRSGLLAVSTNSKFLYRFFLTKFKKSVDILEIILYTETNRSETGCQRPVLWKCSMSIGCDGKYSKGRS